MCVVVFTLFCFAFQLVQSWKLWNSLSSELVACPSLCHLKVEVKVFIFTSRPFQPKAGLPRGGGVKKHFTCEATCGI